jgi:hypothetical protein
LSKIIVLIFLNGSVTMKAFGMTGEKVKESGVYRNSFGKEISLEAGKYFPTCPKEGKNIKWEIDDPS